MLPASRGQDRMIQREPRAHTPYQKKEGPGRDTSAPGQITIRKGITMQSTTLPTWEELNCRHESAMARCMIYVFGPEEKKQEAMAELWDISVQMKEGRFQ